MRFREIGNFAVAVNVFNAVQNSEPVPERDSRARMALSAPGTEQEAIADFDRLSRQYGERLFAIPAPGVGHYGNKISYFTLAALFGGRS